MDVMSDIRKKMEGAVDHLKYELNSLRTGRANPAILDNVYATVYGTKMRIKDLATISVPEPRQILISPFDINNLHPIAKGIELANLNLQPIVDGNIIRMQLPEMNQAAREEMVKQARRKREAAKISIRNVRREGNELIKKQKTDGDLPEDRMKKLEKNIQELTDQCCKEADKITETKEKEIITI
ncbi:MAG: ribosome recycling factor [Chlamydiales bacterium]